MVESDKCLKKIVSHNWNESMDLDSYEGKTSSEFPLSPDVRFIEFNTIFSFFFSFLLSFSPFFSFSFFFQGKIRLFNLHSAFFFVFFFNFRQMQKMKTTMRVDKKISLKLKLCSFVKFVLVILMTVHLFGFIFVLLTKNLQHLHVVFV